MFWWIALVLVFYGIRTHQRLMEQTKLVWNVSLAGQPVEFTAAAKLDGMPASSGERVSLGSHTFTITHPNGVAFSTNLFIWYGRHDLGTVNLARATGKLAIYVRPAAAKLTIRGPEFTKTLTNSVGETLELPTDRYEVQAQFAFSEESDTAVVTANGASIARIVPRFGAVHIASSHPDTTFLLSAKDSAIQARGKTPGTVCELPAGGYVVIAERLGERRSKSVGIESGKTNDVLMRFEYGAVLLESDPAGATVSDDEGTRLGKTPIAIAELRPEKQTFRLALDGFETAVADIQVTADATNRFTINLVSRSYTAAMRSARDYLNAGQYDRAIEFANEALKHKAGDSGASSLAREATGLGQMANARTRATRGDLAAAIAEVTMALESIPDNTEARQLLSDYQDRERQLAEQEARRQAEERAKRERNANIDDLRTIVDGNSRNYEGTCSDRHELVTTNSADAVGEAIQKALVETPPAFKVISYEKTKTGGFILLAKQGVYDGSRTCVIAGARVSTNETLVCFRVIESQTPHSFKVLGVMQAQITTEADRSGERAARFREQVKEGVPMVERRIGSGLGN